jgi:hypothetical protein
MSGVGRRVVGRLKRRSVAQHLTRERAPRLSECAHHVHFAVNAFRFRSPPARASPGSPLSLGGCAAYSRRGAFALETPRPRHRATGFFFALRSPSPDPAPSTAPSPSRSSHTPAPRLGEQVSHTRAAEPSPATPARRDPHQNLRLARAPSFARVPFDVEATTRPATPRPEARTCSRHRTRAHPRAPLSTFPLAAVARPAPGSGAMVVQLWCEFRPPTTT